MKYSSEKTIELLAILDMVFVLFLALSGSFSGFLSMMFYIIAFILPILIGIYFTRESGNARDFLGASGIRMSIPLS